MKTRSIHLNSGLDLLTSLNDYSIQEKISAFVLGVVGDLSHAVIKCPTKSSPVHIEGNLEVITLNGFISPKKSHLHLSISDSKCVVWGGHLENGSIILKGVDVFLGIDDSLDSDNINNSTIHHNNIELYVLQNCPWCSRAIRILKSTNLNYKIIDISNDDEFNQVKKITGSSVFPQIFINGEFLGGYEEFSSYINSIHN